MVNGHVEYLWANEDWQIITLQIIMHMLQVHEDFSIELLGIWPSSWPTSNFTRLNCLDLLTQLVWILLGKQQEGKN